MRKILFACLFVLGGCTSTANVPIEAKVAAACNSYGNAIVAAQAYKSLMPTDALKAMSNTNQSVTRTCEAARDGFFADGPSAALFIVTEATATLISVVCSLNPGDPGCPSVF